ncbi:double zinc ribbon domain-containing protein [uncultured Veillonella sp.]|uniref:ComF family protein n=1 Tax=uncultured Veillonella sp. TaxID=159268 RepID=UPI0025CFD2F1|nr:double zinc ribbon domain-containing protein [uncultured Veillonella sp.]
MSFWDFLFPPVCPHCGASVATQGDWCKTCFTDLLHIRHVPHKFLHYVDDVCVLAEYRGGLKSMIYDVKFNEKKEQSKGAAPFLASYNFYMKYNEFNIVNSNCKTVYDYIVPVPSSETKKKKRGYNQVDLFFKKWAYLLEKIDNRYFKWLDCIYKFDTSNDMWALTNKERHQNIDDAFVIKAEFKDIVVSQKSILIVDDIYTTGATIGAVAKVLKSYNPSRVDGLTLASGSF